MKIDATAPGYSLTLTISEPNLEGEVLAKLIYSNRDKKDQLIFERPGSVASVKQMMDGIFRELYAAAEIKKN